MKIKEYEKSLRKLANMPLYKTSLWPSFGQYTEDWYRVEVGEFKTQLLYCERGNYEVRKYCENLIDLSYQILGIVSPGFTLLASFIAKKLDQFEYQRLLIWLRMSSEIYHMFQINRHFGTCKLNSNVTWMCEELVRMAFFDNTSNAFDSEKHIIKGLTLCGLPSQFASELYLELKNT